MQLTMSGWLEYNTVWCNGSATQYRQSESAVNNVCDRSTFPPPLLLPTPIKDDIIGKKRRRIYMMKTVMMINLSSIHLTQ